MSECEKATNSGLPAVTQLVERSRCIRDAANADRYPTPLRYPGGKQRLGPFFSELLEANQLTCVDFCEPFAGSAGAAIYLLVHGRVNRVYLNDLDRALFAFWYCVVRHGRELCEWIDEVPLTVQEWDRNKEVLRNKSAASLKELGFATFFLNRTNRSGILRAGMIGGRSQAGNDKLSARFQRAALAARIRRISQHASKIVVSQQDALVFLDGLPSRVQRHGLVFLDPPYFRKSPELYLNTLSGRDHESLAHLLNRGSLRRWVLTYDVSARLKALYPGHRIRRFSVRYSADRSRYGRESLLASPGLTIPRLPSVR